MVSNLNVTFGGFWIQVGQALPWPLLACFLAKKDREVGTEFMPPERIQSSPIATTISSAFPTGGVVVQMFDEIPVLKISKPASNGSGRVSPSFATDNRRYGAWKQG